MLASLFAALVLANSMSRGATETFAILLIFWEAVWLCVGLIRNS